MLNMIEIKRQVTEQVAKGNEGDVTAQVEAILTIITQVADVAYVQGKEMERKLMRIKLGLNVPSDGV